MGSRSGKLYANLVPTSRLQAELHERTPFAARQHAVMRDGMAGKRAGFGAKDLEWAGLIEVGFKCAVFGRSFPSTTAS